MVLVMSIKLYNFITSFLNSEFPNYPLSPQPQVYTLFLVLAITCLNPQHTYNTFSIFIKQGELLYLLSPKPNSPS